MARPTTKRAPARYVHKLVMDQGKPRQSVDVEVIDLRELAKDAGRVSEIRDLEHDLSQGKDIKRRMFRRQSGIDETIAWAQSGRGEYVEGQTSFFDCEAGWCGS